MVLIGKPARSRRDKVCLVSTGGSIIKLKLLIFFYAYYPLSSPCQNCPAKQPDTLQ